MSRDKKSCSASCIFCSTGKVSFWSCVLLRVCSLGLYLAMSVSSNSKTVCLSFWDLHCTSGEVFWNNLRVLSQLRPLSESCYTDDSIMLATLSFENVPSLSSAESPLAQNTRPFVPSSTLERIKSARRSPGVDQVSQCFCTTCCRSTYTGSPCILTYFAASSGPLWAVLRGLAPERRSLHRCQSCPDLLLSFVIVLFVRKLGSSLLRYSPKDWTRSMSFNCFDSSSEASVSSVIWAQED